MPLKPVAASVCCVVRTAKDNTLYYRAENEAYLCSKATDVNESELDTTATESEWSIAPHPTPERFSLRNSLPSAPSPFSFSSHVRP